MYNRGRDMITGRLSIDDVNDYDAIGYDAAPRACKYHSYKMVYRPFSIGCQPKAGFVRYDEEYRPSVSGYYGIVTYDRELTAEEIRRFELVEVEQ